MPDAAAGPSFEQVRIEERMRRVRVLLETRFDYLPAPRSTMPATSSGPAPESKYVPCELCRGRGKVVYRRTGRQLARICLACDGSGQRRRRSGDEPYDGYVGRLHASKPRVMSAREYELELGRLRDLERTRRGLTTHERYGWERARAARDASGSYPELDRAVHQLRREHPGYPVDSLGGLLYLQARMGRTIRLPASLHEAITPERRSDALSLHRRHGWTAGEIGRAMGVAREKVGRWLKPSA